MGSQVSLFVKELEDLEKIFYRANPSYCILHLLYMEINRVLLAKFPFEDV